MVLASRQQSFQSRIDSIGCRLVSQIGAALVRLLAVVSIRFLQRSLASAVVLSNRFAALSFQTTEVYGLIANREETY